MGLQLLIFASTHIGCPEDIPSRSLQALRDSDLVVFEEDKPARQFLKQAGIHREYLKWNEHSRKSQSQQDLDDIREALMHGKTVTYMSDQGVANLADPGRTLLRLAYEMNLPVKVIPGPSSITAALAACPFAIEPFYYAGFLDKQQGKREAQLRELDKRREAIVILDTPYRLKQLLESILSTVSNHREIMIARDISGPSEDYTSLKIKSLKSRMKEFQDKLNFVLIIGPK